MIKIVLSSPTQQRHLENSTVKHLQSKLTILSDLLEPLEPENLFSISYLTLGDLTDSSYQPYNEHTWVKYLLYILEAKLVLTREELQLCNQIWLEYKKKYEFGKKG